ncbi:uncharacterized protein LOC131941864 isoform X1 [Physella acuta]|uniref:uncharacterized protein LOC131941864 isoform X1 n=1 Tax=Physella acuta TaxID=109671 RepID=UPI0027DC5FF2|nr:uncharacterized protein LOC131941864 isoform X1 [Physella acuta]
MRALAEFDADETTCVKKTLITADFPSPGLHFTWFRIIMKTNVTFKDVVISMVNVSGGSEDFENFRVQLVSSTTADVSCLAIHTHITRLLLRSTQPLDVCSIYFASGHNINFRETRTIQGTELSNNVFDDLSRTCDTLTTAKKFDVTLDSVYEILSLSVTSSNVQTIIWMYDKDGTLVRKVTNVKSAEYINMYDSSSTSIKKLTVQITRTLNNAEATLCHLALSGECSPPRYGKFCENVCRRQCYQRRCYSDGHCVHCPAGRTGQHCETVDESSYLLDTSTDLDQPTNTRPTSADTFQQLVSENFDLLAVLTLVLGVLLCVIVIIIVICLYPAHIVEVIGNDQLEEYMRLREADEEDDTTDSNSSNFGSESGFTGATSLSQFTLQSNFTEATSISSLSSIRMM